MKPNGGWWYCKKNKHTFKMANGTINWKYFSER